MLIWMRKKSRFFLNAAEYRELQHQQEEQRRAAAGPPAGRCTGPCRGRAAGDAGSGAQFRKVLGEHIAAAADEPDLQQELVRMQSQTGEILGWVEITEQCCKGAPSGARLYAHHPETAENLR